MLTWLLEKGCATAGRWESIGQVPSDSHCRHRKLRRLSQKDLTQICANKVRVFEAVPIVVSYAVSIVFQGLS